MMEYKGYFANIEYDSEDKIFHGEVIGLNDVITFQGTSVKELEKEFHESVKDYLEFCRKENRDPEKTFSGILNLRMGADRHRVVAAQAQIHKQSINEWINEAIEAKLEKEA